MGKKPNFINRHIDISLTENEMTDFIKATKKKTKGILIAPFQVFLGAIKNTNYGEVGNVEPADQTTFQQVFTGQDDVLAVWENSTSAKKVNEDDKFFTKQFQTGRTIIGMESSQQGLSQFAKKANASLSNFTIQQASISVSVILEKEEFSFDDLFKFYIIPQSGTNQYLFISQLITYTSPSGQKMQEVIFSSVNDFLESTGNAISQYIQNTGMGSGYAFPKVEYTEKKEPYFVLDQKRLANKPITNIQIEIYGPAIFSGAVVVGRPSSTSNQKIVPPRMLMNYKFKTPIGSSITNKSSGENNYKVIYDARINAVGYFDEWKEKVRTNYDENANKKFEGTIETSIAQVDKTNNGTDYLPAWNTGWVHDPTIETGGEYATPENRLTNGSVSFKVDTPYHNHFNTMAMIQMGQLKLPIGLKETTIWNLKDIPIVGGIANLFTFGYPVGWQNTDTIIAGKPFAGFISATLYDFLAQLGLDETNGVIPVDALRDEESDPVSSFIGASATTTILRWDLTHKGRKTEGGNLRLLDTMDMGQEYMEDGTTPGWYFDGTETWDDPGNEVNEGYEIDMIDPIIIGHADYKITAFNGNDTLYSSIHSTRAKYTGTIREHHNITKHSNWSEIDGATIEYPAAIPDPDPTDATSLPDKTANVNYERKRNYEGNKSGSNPNFREEFPLTIDLKQSFGLTLQEIIDAGYKYIKVESSTEQNWVSVASTGEEKEIVKIPLTTLNDSNDWVYITSDPQGTLQYVNTYAVDVKEVKFITSCVYDRTETFNDALIKTGANVKVKYEDDVFYIGAETLIDAEGGITTTSDTCGYTMTPGIVKVNAKVSTLTITEK